MIILFFAARQRKGALADEHIEAALTLLDIPVEDARSRQSTSDFPRFLRLPRPCAAVP
jgi:hypothetical protein